MATAIKTAEHSDADSPREEFLAFCGDSETYAVVDQVVGEMMLQHASIREGGVKEAVKHLVRTARRACC
jgi:hypothetical protein